MPRKPIGRYLRTLDGSVIRRHERLWVGKYIGGKLYLHKQYVGRIMSDYVWKARTDRLQSECPGFTFNTLCWMPGAKAIRFDEAPDFDTAREPTPGRSVTIFKDGAIKRGYTSAIWHHKWLWVMDDYSGFDVEESYRWSKHWLSLLPEPASGLPALWQSQLAGYQIEETYKEGSQTA